LIASGSRDGSILVWDLNDQISAAQGFAAEIKDTDPIKEDEGRQCKNGKSSGAKLSAKKLPMSPPRDEDESKD
jgi:hypothetical protein